MHLSRGLSSAFQSMGLEHPRYNGLIRGAGLAIAVADGARLRADPGGHLLRGAAVKLDAKIPGGAIADKWDRHRFEMKLVNPANKRKFTIIVVGTGLAGASASAVARRAGLQRQGVLHPRLAAPRPQHRRPGRHQRRQELPQRRRQRRAAVLRHGQGRRLPRPRGQRLSPGPDQRPDHRPGGRPGRAVRARVRRRPRQPLVRRRPGLAHLLRPRPDRAAAADRRLPVADAAGRGRPGDAVPQPRDARSRARRRQGARHHRAQPADRRARVARRRRRLPRHRRLRHGLLPLDQRRELERHGGVALLQARRAVRQPVLHADPPDLHPGVGRSPVQAHADEREPAQRRARLGAEDAAATSGRRSRSPKPSATTTSNGATRASATWCPATSRRAPPRRSATKAAASARRSWPSTWISPTRSAGSARTPCARATATCSRCTRRSPTRIRTRCRCGSTPPSTTRWAACGWTTT